MKRHYWLSSVFLGLALAVGFSSTALAVAATPSPTTTELTISPSGPVAQGTSLTLTASVSASGRPVSPGLVLFCNAAAAYCEDVNIFGQAQLKANGTASLHLILPIGPHEIRADFRGTKSDAPSSSATEDLMVSGKYHTSTTVAANPPSYSATVTAYGPLAANGNVSFVDATDSNLVFASAPLKLTNTLTALARPILLAKGAGAYFPLAVADFNGDGILDMIVTGPTNPLFMRGNPDGTFTQKPSTGLPSSGGPYVAADFNSDGILDVAVVQGGSIAILLGQGDGNFSLQSTIDIQSHSPATIVAGDFNGDGTSDLLITDHYWSTAAVLLGDGKGGFLPAPSVDLWALQANAAAVAADFNGDGLADVAVTVSNGDVGSSVSLLLSKGDGTFVTTSGLAPCGFSNPELVVADFNRDGIPDIVESGCGSNLPTLMGNGDGTFRYVWVTGPPFGEEWAPSPIGGGDFNGDGIPDLLLTNSDSGQFGLLLGKGDGTFAAGPFISLPGLEAPQFLVLDDLNGDGIPDFLIGVVPNDLTTHMGEPAVYEWFPYVQQTSQAKATNVTLPGSGTQQVFARFFGDANHIGSYSTTVPTTH